MEILHGASYFMLDASFRMLRDSVICELNELYCCFFSNAFYVNIVTFEGTNIYVLTNDD